MIGSVLAGGSVVATVAAAGDWFGTNLIWPAFTYTEERIPFNYKSLLSNIEVGLHLDVVRK